MRTPAPRPWLVAAAAWAAAAGAGVPIVDRRSRAAGLSLATLYVNNPMFGGVDYITAFLWGFGAQVATNGFAAFAASVGVLPQPAAGGP